jgi:hypothetical protein
MMVVGVRIVDIRAGGLMVGSVSGIVGSGGLVIVVGGVIMGVIKAGGLMIGMLTEFCRLIRDLPEFVLVGVPSLSVSIFPWSNETRGVKVYSSVFPNPLPVAEFKVLVRSSCESERIGI